ncbi:MAG: hypothetical protein V5A64_02570 [Candidatus Thermoplasmatota archaeon]
MKRKLFTLIFAVFIVVCFSGCLEHKSDGKADTEESQVFSKFMGEWVEDADPPNNLTWIFYENNSIEFISYPGVNVYHYWGEFTLEGDILDVSAMPVLSDRFKYDFSEDDGKITLTSVYGGDKTILYKVE